MESLYLSIYLDSKWISRIFPDVLYADTGTKKEKTLLSGLVKKIFKKQCHQHLKFIFQIVVIIDCTEIKREPAHVLYEIICILITNQGTQLNF